MQLVGDAVKTDSKESFIHSLKKARGLKGPKMITYAIAAAVISLIWRARNAKIFAHHMLPVQT